MVQVIQCPHCGWQNEPAAIMCGGCGRPLPMMGATSGDGRAAGASFAAASPGNAEYPTLSDLPTQEDLPRPAITAAALRSTGAPAAGGKPAVWPGAQEQRTPRSQERRGGWWRGLLAGVLALGLLVGLAAGVWALAVRPTLHAQVDGSIDSGLSSVIGRLPAITDSQLRSGQIFRGSETDANTVLAKDIVPNSGLDSATVSFQQGQVVVTYVALGQQGTISTTLQVQGGQLEATNTQVDGELSWVETGDELQATINRALQHVQAKTPHGFKSVQVDGGQITVVLNSAGS